MTWTLAESYRYCERLARREAGNFYHAFRLLPRKKRLAMCALYAFLRVADDLSDGPGTSDEKRTLLTAWRRQLHESLTGAYTHPLHPAFHHTVEGNRIPLTYIHAVLDGVEMDLEPRLYASFDQLYGYCYRVASAVGLCCIHIWEFKDDKALAYAEAAGIAFQLTNILRDLREDAARERIYLPLEDFDQFGYRPEQLMRNERGDPFRALMQFEARRARSYYEASEPLNELLAPSGRAVFQVMSRTYRELLEAIVESDFDVFARRIHLSPWRKSWLALKALPVRFGWI